MGNVASNVKNSMRQGDCLVKEFFIVTTSNIGLLGINKRGQRCNAVRPYAQALIAF